MPVTRWPAHSVPSLSPVTWRILLGDTAAWLGVGFTFPFLLVYLQEIRHLPAAQAGMILSLIGAAALVATPLTGAWTDRVGARTMTLVSLGVVVLGTLGLAVAPGVGAATLAGLVYGVGQAALFPTVMTLLGTAEGPAARSSAFALRWTGINIGVGIGAVAGGVMVDVERPETFTLLFGAQALVTLVALALFALAPRVRVTSPSAAPSRAERGRAPWRDRNLLVAAVLTLLAYALGLSQLQTGFSLYALEHLLLTPKVLGLALGLNALTIVVLQLAVLRGLRSAQRTTAVLGLFILWALAWATAGLAGSAGMAAPWLFALAALLFGLGETLLSPSLPAIAADLAPAGQLGQYNASFAFAGAIGRVVAPILASTLLSQGQVPAFFTCMIGGCLLAAAVTLWYRRSLPARVNSFSQPAEA